ncbi:MAG: glutamate synthase-related protein [Crenarchaeota archaeon]|nr:glutamate synthase-related protein [Thermoproteota archaeon]
MGARSSIGGSSATGTRIRFSADPMPTGICPICVEECPILCEISKSALRGRECLYPRSDLFGKSVIASNKYYGIDWADLQLMSELRAEATYPEEFRDEDKAIFERVKIGVEVGRKHRIKLRVPVIIAGLGSTTVAKNNWEHLASGAAISGTIMTVGENVCGVDPESIISNGKVQKSPEMEFRIKTFRDWWDGEYGDIVVQTNVEDQRLGVDVYVITKLEVNGIERKWGQGAKAIGGEIRVKDLQRAIELKRRGYVVLPDPEDPGVQEAWKMGAIESFERHSRIGMPTIESFCEDVDKLREQGAKIVSLKMGQYRPAVIAWAMKAASEAKVDYVTFDGQGGGTGMSPWPMMLEMGTPTLYMLALVIKAARILDKKGKYVPDIFIAGGIINETQILKAMALSGFPDKDRPYVIGASVAKPALTAAMKAKYFAKLAKEGTLSKIAPEFTQIYGDKLETIFAVAGDLKNRYGDKWSQIPAGGIGIYSYFVDRIGTGLKQLLAGMRKFDIKLVKRTDVAALTERAAKVFEIPLIEDLDKDVFEKILKS